jgi:hypothetical protein
MVFEHKKEVVAALAGCNPVFSEKRQVEPEAQRGAIQDVSEIRVPGVQAALGRDPIDLGERKKAQVLLCWFLIIHEKSGRFANCEPGGFTDRYK